jgi:hypothetical protein
MTAETLLTLISPTLPWFSKCFFIIMFSAFSSSSSFVSPSSPSLDYLSSLSSSLSVQFRRSRSSVNRLTNQLAANKREAARKLSKLDLIEHSANSFTSKPVEFESLQTLLSAPLSSSSYVSSQSGRVFSGEKHSYFDELARAPLPLSIGNQNKPKHSKEIEKKENQPIPSKQREFGEGKTKGKWRKFIEESESESEAEEEQSEEEGEKTTNKENQSEKEESNEKFRVLSDQNKREDEKSCAFSFSSPSSALNRMNQLDWALLMENLSPRVDLLIQQIAQANSINESSACFTAGSTQQQQTPLKRPSSSSFLSHSHSLPSISSSSLSSPLSVSSSSLSVIDPSTSVYQHHKLVGLSHNATKFKRTLANQPSADSLALSRLKYK